jgi:leucyl aminopeptidase
MKLTVESKPASKAGVVRVRFLPREDCRRIDPPPADSEFSGKARQTLYQRDQGLLYVGLGARKAVNGSRALRQAAGVATMFLKRIGQTQISFVPGEWGAEAGAVAEGALLADYRFDRYQEKKVAPLELLHLEVGAAELASARAAVERGRIVAEATNLCRDVGNLPGNVLTPAELAEIAQRMARRHGLKVRVFDEELLAARRFGGLLAVGGGSVQPPRLIVLEHRGGPKGERPLVLVGKAITFDSGGISIKPAANMEEMIFDKCGGMAVLGAMAAIGKLKLKKNVIGVLAAAENMPSATAYRPGDIVTAYDGTHIEVINTDAEGRIVLGDAIAYARTDLKAAAIIDLATLTGACGVALGEYTAGFWHNHADFGRAVSEASERAGERIWHMPLHQEYEDQIRSDVAQLKNTGGRLGGACTAAAFLKAFARETPWAHLDIAYMANRDKDLPFQARGATGFGVRTLVELAEAWGGI